MRRRALAVPLAACAGLIVWAVWPRGPALVLYTSPHFTLDKKTFRLQAQVPTGWQCASSMCKEISGAPQCSKPLL